MGNTFQTGRLINGLFVDASGNVGIGTTTPLTILDVRQAATGAATVNVAFRDSSTNGNALQIWNGNNEARFRAVYYGTPSDQNITFYTITSGGAESEKMRISANGRVGIGTNSPNDLLEVRGGFIRLSATAGNGPQFNIYSNGQTNNHVTLAQGFALATDNIGYLYNRANADFVFGTNNAERMRISANGNVGIGTSSPSQKLTIGATNGYPIIDFYNSGTGFGDIGYNAGTSTFNLSSYSTTPLAFYTNGSERMRITTGGDVNVINNNIGLHGGYIRLRNSAGTVTYGLFLQKSTWTGSGADYTPSIAAEGGYGISFFTNGSAAERLQITTRGMLSYPNVPLDNINIDTSTPISIATGGTISFGTFSGMIIVNNMANGVCAMWLVGAGYTSLVGASYGGAAGSMSYSGAINGYVWTSTYGATANYGIFAVRTRQNA